MHVARFAMMRAPMQLVCRARDLDVANVDRSLVGHAIVHIKFEFVVCKELWRCQREPCRCLQSLSHRSEMRGKLPHPVPGYHGSLLTEMLFVMQAGLPRAGAASSSSR